VARHAINQINVNSVFKSAPTQYKTANRHRSRFKKKKKLTRAVISIAQLSHSLISLASESHYSCVLIHFNFTKIFNIGA
jgi:hypothetical protein